jgi:hypothetical protein
MGLLTEVVKRARAQKEARETALRKSRAFMGVAPVRVAAKAESGMSALALRAQLGAR